MTERKWPHRDAPAVELRISSRHSEPDRVGGPVVITDVTPTLVITSDGERYNRASLRPIREGRTSPRVLVPPTDNRVLCVEARKMLAELARVADNQAALGFTDPETYVGSLARMVVLSTDAHRRLLALLRDASRGENR